MINILSNQKFQFQRENMLLNVEVNVLCKNLGQTFVVDEKYEFIKQIG